MINCNDSNNLYDILKEYSQTNFYPFHMPGHKRNNELLKGCLPYEIDVTEIDGFDNLHNPNGIIKKITEKVRRLFKSQNSFLLVNGSTCGILAAVHCVTKYGDKIIIAANCHKSVYNACQLNNLSLEYIYPCQDEKSGVCCSIAPESVEEALKNTPDSKAVFVTSPTYEGVISDIKKIAEITHKYKIPLIVDNAHGAHQIFSGLDKGEPVISGADIVISSLHKTLPALTQTAIAHVNGNLVSAECFAKELAIFETSSPSYILMSSIDLCMDFLANGEELFGQYRNNLSKFSEQMKKLKNLTVLCHGNDTLSKHDFYYFDYGKIVICTSGTNINGTELANILRNKYYLELEMAYSSYAVAMTSVCDTEKGFEKLKYALLDIDTKIVRNKKYIYPLKMPKRDKSKLSGGKISEKYIFAYPPGIPIVIPGDEINEEVLQYIGHLKKCGVNITEQ